MSSAPERDREGFIQHLGLGAGFDDFLSPVHEQSHSNWTPALTAGCINDCLRGGFGMAAVGCVDQIFGDGFQL